jgi:hypothetical protein
MGPREFLSTSRMWRVAERLFLGFPGGFSKLSLLALTRFASHTPRLVSTLNFYFYFMYSFEDIFGCTRGFLLCFIATIYVSFTGFNNAPPSAAPLTAVGGLFVLGISAISAASIYNATQSLDFLKPM